MTLTGRRGSARLAVVGPGLLAGLSDDDRAGITTYSVLGADHGYQLLWVLLLSPSRDLPCQPPRMNIVTGRGADRTGASAPSVGVGGAVLAALVVANMGTTCARIRRYCSQFELFGISRHQRAAA